MKLTTTPDTLAACQAYCETLKSEVTRLQAESEVHSHDADSLSERCEQLERHGAEHQVEVGRLKAENARIRHEYALHNGDDGLEIHEAFGKCAECQDGFMVNEGAAGRTYLGEQFYHSECLANAVENHWREKLSASEARERAWREAWESIKGVCRDYGAHSIVKWMTALQPQERATDTHQADVPQATK